MDDVEKQKEAVVVEEEIEEQNPLLELLAVPRYVAEKIWTESIEMNSSTDKICPSPGCNNGSAWLVQSANPSHRQPYFVECRKSGQIVL